MLFRMLLNIIAKIDVFQSLAMISSENSYVRPTFNHNKVFKVVDGRHGVIEVGYGTRNICFE